MSRAGKLKAFGALAGNLFRRPVTVPEDYAFTAVSFRWLPRRDGEKCTGCGACNERCSSGATSLDDADGVRTVSIDGLRCIFCGRCADVCPEKALDLLLEPGPVDTARISLSRGSEEPKPTVDTRLGLQKCRICGEYMPVTEKYLAAVRERTLRNLKPETAAIVREDMEKYLTACVDCRRKHSLEWDTHPRKFI